MTPDGGKVICELRLAISFGAETGGGTTFSCGSYPRPWRPVGTFAAWGAGGTAVSFLKVPPANLASLLISLSEGAGCTTRDCGSVSCAFKFAISFGAETGGGTTVSRDSYPRLACRPVRLLAAWGAGGTAV